MLSMLSMMLFPITLALLVLVTWNMVVWRRVPIAGVDATDSVSVLIPARNEAENLPALLRALSGQESASIAEILVYDDHSEDDTAHIVQERTKPDPRIRLVHPHPLPVGWYGKPFACHSLAREAVGKWLLFLDADARIQPAGVSSIVREARHLNCTLLSCWPRIEMRGFWEAVLMPMLNFSVFTLFPARLSFSRNDPNLGLAHGACMLVHRETYFRVGGHERVRGELFEDTLLARVWRAHGEMGHCVDGQDIVRVRMYDSLDGIWNGFQKNFFPAFRSTPSFLLFLTFHFIAFLLPFLVLPFVLYNPLANPYLLAVLANIVLARAVMSTRFSYPYWTVLFHPVAEVILLAIGITSWWRCVRGRGVTWKGRNYKPGRRKSEAP